MLATGSKHGLDCSPKGDLPGFVEVADDGRTLFIPDRRGNNRIDGLKNILEDPRIALIFFVPGANRTYRVTGRARASARMRTSAGRCSVNGKEPATVMVVTVEQAFQHCPKALVRSNLWKAGSGARPQGVPTLGDFAAARTPGMDGAALYQNFEDPNSCYVRSHWDIHCKNVRRGPMGYGRLARARTMPRMSSMSPQLRY